MIVLQPNNPSGCNAHCPPLIVEGVRNCCGQMIFPPGTNNRRNAMDCCAVRAMGTKYSGHLLSVVIENNYQPRRPEGHTITVAQPVTRHHLGPALV